MARIRTIVGLLLVGAILGSLVTVGGFQFYEAKKSPVSKTTQKKPLVEKKVLGKEVWDWFNLGVTR